MPVTAFLFAARIWGVVWSIFLVAVLTVMYLLEQTSAESYRYASLAFSSTYYFISYLGLFAGVLGVILLFVRSNDDTLARLRATTVQLREQEAQTAAQNELLRAKEAELKRSNRDLELFAYVASHDLKEPLRMVSSYAQLLKRSATPILPDKELTYLGYLSDGATRMQVMLDDLLSHSRVGKERQREQNVDLNKVMLLVGNYLRLDLEQSGGSFTFSEMPTVTGRTTHYIQLFQNLVANAIKFRREGVAPVVHIEATTEASGDVVIAVRDNGIGIPAADTQRIFGVFQRLHGRDRFEGSGIGLATVKRILDEIGASIQVQSEEGLGTTFTIHVPAERVVRDQP